MPQDEEATVVNEVVEEESTQSAATADENNSPTSEEATPESVQADDGELHLPAKEESEESTDDTDESDGNEEKPQTRADKRIQQLDSEIEDLERKLTPQEEIRERVARKNELQRQVEERNSEAYQAPELPTVDSLLEEVNPETGDYYTRAEAKLELIERRDQQREYNDKLRQYNQQVAESIYTLETETKAVLRDFPMFNKESPEFNQAIADKVAKIIEPAIIRDPSTGQIIGSNVSVYDIYATIAAASSESAKKSRIEGQKSTERMLSQADPIAGSRGKEKTYDKMSLKEKEAYLRKRGHDV